MLLPPRYKNARVLATALYGHVLLCTDTVTGDAVAIKCMQLSSARGDWNTVAQVARDIKMELRVHRALSANGGHVNLLRLRDHFQDDARVCLVLDYCPSGDLYSNLRTQGMLAMATVWAYFGQIARAVAYIHGRGFAHRDLSLENVLVDRNGQCLVCDFGLATPASKWSCQTVGKSFYMAPEVVAGDMYDPKQADVWSLGVILYMLVAGTPLVGIANVSDHRYCFMATYGLRSLVSDAHCQRMDTKVMRLLEGMLAMDPAKRLHMDDVVALTSESSRRARHRSIGQTIKVWFRFKGRKRANEALVVEA